MQDRFGRKIDYMRVSVTDRCNLRCVYCMPKQGVDSIPHDDILSYEEIVRVVRAAASLGIEKIKITGGEPLVRKGVASLVRMVKAIPGIRTVTITTNGVLFPQYGEELAAAGLDGVNFSLDSLDRQTFESLTRFDALESVAEGIRLALRLGLKTKLNCVPMQTQLSSDRMNIAALARDNPLDVRFIEMMPIGLGCDFETMSNDDVFKELADAFGQPVRSKISHGSGPAVYYDFQGFQGSIGFISSLSHSFCGSCNRIRLTADGELKPCLCYQDGLALKPLLRSGVSDDKLTGVMADVIEGKPEKHMLGKTASSAQETRKMVQIGG